MPMSNENESGAGPPKASPAPAHREVRYEHSLNLAPLLAHLGASLVVSTYQAGKLVVIGVDQAGALALSFHNFERIMGVAVRPDRMAVGSLTQGWVLRAAPGIASPLGPAGPHRARFLGRSSPLTAEYPNH